MKRKLYYTVDFDNDMMFKSIKMYSIENDTPEIIAEINDVGISDDPKDFIQGYLNDNGLGDESFEFIKL